MLYLGAAGCAIINYKTKRKLFTKKHSFQTFCSWNINQIQSLKHIVNFIKYLNFVIENETQSFSISICFLYAYLIQIISISASICWISRFATRQKTPRDKPRNPTYLSLDRNNLYSISIQKTDAY